MLKLFVIIECFRGSLSSFSSTTLAVSCKDRPLIYVMAHYTGKKTVILTVLLVYVMATVYVINFHSDCQPELDVTPGVSKVRKRPLVNLEEDFESPNNLDLLSDSTLLDPNLASNTVYYIWCGKRWFEYQHYMSVLSVIKEVRPDLIIFYYDQYPVSDKWIYNTWLKELKESFPFLRFRPLSGDEKAAACEGHANPRLSFAYSRLTVRGGIYISENTILNRFPHYFKNITLVNAMNEKTKTGFIMSKGGLPGQYSLQWLARDPRWKSQTLECGTVKDFINAGAKNKPLCVSNTGTFYPKDIWERNDDFGKLVRRIMYDSPEIAVVKPSYDQLIPNIAHIVWIGGGKMDFLFYLCVLSLLYVAEVENVYIHGDAPPTGKYWEQIRLNPRIRLIHRETPKTVYGTDVHVLSHVTDVWRVDFMVKYGGIYVDTDTVFVKPLDYTIRGYDAVGSYDWTYWNHPFPDTINFGVAIGKKGAKYWHLFQESMKWFIDSDWAWNGLRQPYKIKERHPDLVRIDPHLQVICYKYKCHPTWHPEYHNESVHHLNSNSIKNWREDVYAFHWTLPTPPELHNKTALIKSDSMFAEIGRYILEKADLL